MRMCRQMPISDLGELGELVLGMFDLLAEWLIVFCHCSCIVHTDVCSLYLFIAVSNSFSVEHLRHFTAVANFSVV